MGNSVHICRINGEDVIIEDNAMNDVLIIRRAKDNSLFFQGISQIDSPFIYEKGILYHKNGKPKCDNGYFYADEYNGCMNNGKRLGKLYFDNGKVKYEGGFYEGYFDGIGTLYYKNGRVKYEGRFYEGHFDGIGKLYYKNGKVKYSGRFCEGHLHGKGKYYEYVDGKIKFRYDGEFTNNKFHGKGIYYEYVNGKKIKRYEGTFKKGYFNGRGVYYYDDGSKEDGIWKKGCYRTNYKVPNPKK